MTLGNWDGWEHMALLPDWFVVVSQRLELAGYLWVRQTSRRRQNQACQHTACSRPKSVHRWTKPHPTSSVVQNM